MVAVMEGLEEARFESKKINKEEVFAIFQVNKDETWIEWGIKGIAGRGNGCDLVLFSSFLPTAPAGGRGFQPVGPSLRPSQAPSVALHIGRLESISLLS